MTRDARLDAFASERTDAEDSAEELETGDAIDETTDGPIEDEKRDTPEGEGRDDTSPSLATTSEWTPDGEECATCGEIVERRWRQDDALVCPDCKDWSEV